jgi:hypothetical protein
MPVASSQATLPRDCIDPWALPDCLAGGLCTGLIQEEGYCDIDTAAFGVPLRLTMRSRPAAAVWRRRARCSRSRRAGLLRPRRPVGTRGT